MKSKLAFVRQPVSIPRKNAFSLRCYRSYPFLLDTARDFLIDSMNSAKLDVRMTIEGKDFAMIEDFVQTLVNLMIDAGTDETIKHLNIGVQGVQTR